MIIESKKQLSEIHIDKLVSYIRSPQFDTIRTSLLQKYFYYFSKNTDLTLIDKYFKHNSSFFKGIELSEKDKSILFSPLMSSYFNSMEVANNQKDFFIENLLDTMLALKIGFKNKFYSSVSIYSNYSFSDTFWKIYFKTAFRDLKNLDSCFKKLRKLSFEFDSMFSKLEESITSNLINSISMKELVEKYDFQWPKEIKSEVRIKIIDEIHDSVRNFSEWISLLKYNTESIDKDYILKLYQKDQEISDRLLFRYQGTFLSELIENKIGINYTSTSFVLIDDLVSSRNVKDFIGKKIGRDSKKVIKDFMSLVKSKGMDFSLISYLDTISEMDINHIHTLLQVKEINKEFFLDRGECVWVKFLITKVSDHRKKAYIEQSYIDHKTIKSICSYLPKIKIDNVEWKPITNISKLEIALQVEFERSSSKQNLFLNQVEKYPVLKKINGLKVDNLRFEVPNHSNEILAYAIKMRNCIYRDYLMKCYMNTSILIGVYKDDELAYNLELGREFVHQYDLTKSINGGKFVKKLLLLKLEQKFKKDIPESDKRKIVKVLQDNQIIE